MHKRRPRGPACHRHRNSETLTPRHHLRRSPAIHIRLIKYDVLTHVRWPGRQHLLFAVNQIAGIKSSQLKPMPMRNRVRRASLHTIPAKDTSIVVDVVDFGVALGAAYAEFGGVVGGFDVDAVGGTVGGAEEAGYALFQSVFVALQDVGAAEAGFELRSLERSFAVGIIFYRRGLEHLHEGDAHPFGDGGDIFQDRHFFTSIPDADAAVGGWRAARYFRAGWRVAHAKTAFACAKAVSEIAIISCSTRRR